MTQTFVTIIASVPVAEIEPLRARIMAMGNPATPEIQQRLHDSGLHFASLNVFAASAGDCGHLVLEFSGDGAAAALIGSVARDLAQALTPVFAAARGRGAGSLESFLSAHSVPVGAGLTSNPGLCFSGAPGMTVARIRREAALAARVADIVAAQARRPSALDVLDRTRDALTADPDLAWALEPPETPPPADQPPGALDIPGLLGLVLPLLATFFWPAAIALFLAALIGGVRAAWTLEALAIHGDGLWVSSRVLGGAAAWGGWTLLAVLIAVAAAYFALRRQEATDRQVDSPAPPGDISAILRRENACAQNHLAALSVIKPGVIRQVTLRLGFWTIGQFATRFYAPGFLGPLGTINFARWVTVPGTRDLLFLSNYGGSWESYLEDFISQAHAGLTGVWSNTLGFPRAANLFLDGATDGDRFKWWARRQQTPTAFWYSAYPALTTANIRVNARIRWGLAGALTEDEARAWLALFGSAPEPPSLLETNEIQSLALGGLGFLPEGECLAVRLSDDRDASRAFLRALAPTIAFADGRAHAQGVFIGLAASALRKLGLPDDAFDTLPPAYLDGMDAPWRSRILGDSGRDAPENWRWGGPAQGGGADATVMMLARDAGSLSHLSERVRQMVAHHGHGVLADIPFEPQPVKPPAGSAYVAKYEPFGFVDGISQPIIRGTYKAARGADPIHLVEAGEFILGYPDGLGKLPPTPLLAAIHDPANRLPTQAPTADDFSTTAVNAPRDLGRNGTFLAVRQLEQDVDGFWAFCEREAARLAGAFPHGFIPTREYIAAKIVGRWPDGSPLVRYPHWPANASPTPSHPLSRPSTREHVQASTGIASTPLGAPLGASQSRAEPVSAPAAAESPPRFPPDNDFLLGAEDPQATRCPFGAHIRRSNPRESFDPGSLDQLAITNRHRIMRVGRRYRPTPGDNPGILFMALNGDFERQFEFVQQTWLRGASFSGLSNERDPLTVGGEGGGLTIPTDAGPVRLAPLPSFVTVRGGGYFFLPGKRTLDFLAA